MDFGDNSDNVDWNEELQKAKKESGIARARYLLAQAVQILMDATNERDWSLTETREAAGGLKRILSENVDTLGEDFVIEFGVHVEKIVQLAESQESLNEATQYIGEKYDPGS